MIKKQILTGGQEGLGRGVPAQESSTRRKASASFHFSLLNLSNTCYNNPTIDHSRRDGRREKSQSEPERGGGGGARGRNAVFAAQKLVMLRKLE